MSDAYYRLDLELDFVGSGPSKVNRAAPEVSRICAVAVAAARRVIEDAGYNVARVGHGCLRLDEEER